MTDRTEKHGQSGYTLAEVMIAAFIGSLVLAQVLAALIASQRIYRDTVSDCELTYKTCALREKLLYDLGDGDVGGLASALRNGTASPSASADRKSLSYLRSDGAAGSFSLNGTELETDDDDITAWVAPGSAYFPANAQMFSVTASNSIGSNNFVTLNIDLRMRNGIRKYGRRLRVVSQLVNPQNN